MKEAGKKRGVVIASQPSTGDILALVNLPTYDSNTFARGISSEEYGRLATDPDKPLFERALNGEYPSGSTIKPIVAVAGLQEGIITGATRLMSSGGIRFGQWLFPDWKPGGHGITDVVKAIAESVNTFFYAIGGGYGDILGLGPERLLSYFRLFGLGSETGVDAQEKKGFVPSPEWKRGKTGEPWYIGDTYHVAIGQGDVSVTPLQVNLFTSYFANGGVNYQPRFVRESIDTPTGHRTQIESKVYRKDVVASQHVALVREGMRQTVVSGSGRRLSLLPVSAAGKTGTAQWNTTKPPHAWFTGWAPFENPAVVITVLVEEGEEGSRIASPVAYEILKWYFEREQRAGDKK
jgi:penicillin-binding protein 2